MQLHAVNNNPEAHSPTDADACGPAPNDHCQLVLLMQNNKDENIYRETPL